MPTQSRWVKCVDACLQCNTVSRRYNSNIFSNKNFHRPMCQKPPMKKFRAANASKPFFFVLLFCIFSFFPFCFNYECRYRKLGTILARQMEDAFAIKKVASCLMPLLSRRSLAVFPLAPVAVALCLCLEMSLRFVVSVARMRPQPFIRVISGHLFNHDPAIITSHNLVTPHKSSSCLLQFAAKQSYFLGHQHRERLGRRLHSGTAHSCVMSIIFVAVESLPSCMLTGERRGRSVGHPGGQIS